MIELNIYLKEHCQTRLTAVREVCPGVNFSVEIYGKTSVKYYQYQVVQDIWTNGALHSPRTKRDLDKRNIMYIPHVHIIRRHKEEEYLEGGEVIESGIENRRINH